MSTIRKPLAFQTEPPPALAVPLRLNPKLVVLCLLAVVFGLLAVSLPLQWLLHQTDRDMPLLVVKAFDFDSENNLPTWFSSAILLSSAAVLFLIHRAERRQGDRSAPWWAGLSLVFLYLSIDEAASLHEATVERMQGLIDAEGALYAAWVIPAGIVMAIFGLIYLRFFLSLPRRMQGLFFLAAALFVGGAMGVEMLAWHYRYPLHAPDPTDWEGSKDIVWALLSHLEEVMEMVAVIIFLYALLSHLAEERVEIRLAVASPARSEGDADRERPHAPSPERGGLAFTEGRADLLRAGARR